MKIRFEEFGQVGLLDFMGSDLDVVNAARVSFAKHSDSFGVEEEGVLRFMMRERHGSPFENGGVFKYFVECPIFVAREWFRHRIGSFNEQSGRYSKLSPVFYMPANAYTQVGKPGAYTFERDDAMTPFLREDLEYAYAHAWEIYETLLEDGIAKELARTVLPVGIHTQFIWTVNARSLMNFLSLRNAETAQQAIREYAVKVEERFAEKMPVTYDAFIQNERVAP